MTERHFRVCSPVGRKGGIRCARRRRHAQPVDPPGTSRCAGRDMPRTAQPLPYSNIPHRHHRRHPPRNRPCRRPCSGWRYFSLLFLALAINWAANPSNRLGNWLDLERQSRLSSPDWFRHPSACLLSVLFVGLHPATLQMSDCFFVHPGCTFATNCRISRLGPPQSLRSPPDSPFSRADTFHETEAGLHTRQLGGASLRSLKNSRRSRATRFMWVVNSPTAHTSVAGFGATTLQSRRPLTGTSS